MCGGGTGSMAEARRNYLLLQSLLLLLLVVLGAASHEGSLRRRRSLRLPLVPGNEPLPNLETVKSNSSSSGGRKRTPLEFFEVARPVEVPEGVKPCSVVLLEHSFGDTYGLPPAEAAYRPAANCGKQWDKVVLKWRGACQGRQYDRISMVWLNGVEILRSCTAEPFPQGTVWEVEKDVTRYSALFRENGTLVMYLANVVDETYTGIINITLQLLFYPGSPDNQTRTSTAAAGATFLVSESEQEVPVVAGANGTGFSSAPDVILPVTHMPDVLQEGGYIQRIENSSHTVAVVVDGIPRNVYRAVLEVCVSSHEQDEFWYINAPNLWVAANNLSEPENGPFREVVARLDGTAVGAVWPLAVVYTGGLNANMWGPAAAIGAFNLPSYDIDITAFVGSIVDGSSHTVSFAVTNALNAWFVQGNLHLWLDAGSRQTGGQLDAYSAPGYSQELDTHGYEGGPDGTFTTSAARRISHSGTVLSSHGRLTWSADYHYAFKNRMRYTDQGDAQIVHQDTEVSSTVVVKTEARDLVNWRHVLAFPLRFYQRDAHLADESVHITFNLTHGLDEDDALILPGSSNSSSSGVGSGRFTSLHNNQSAWSLRIMFPDNTTTDASESEQSYRYESSSGCYWRHMLARDHSVVADHVDTQCKASQEHTARGDLGSLYRSPSLLDYSIDWKRKSCNLVAGRPTTTWSEDRDEENALDACAIAPAPTSREL